MGDLLNKFYDKAKQSNAIRALANLPILSNIKERIMTHILLQDRNHESWISKHLEHRKTLYCSTAEPGLLSFITTVWNTPVQYLKILAESLLVQAKVHDFEWIVLDNGSKDEDTINYLNDLASNSFVKLYKVEDNMGIIGGMNYCLQKASGRYVLPLDSDDYLYPDALSILTWHIKEFNYPSILYSDEDKIIKNKSVMPYFKPDWDPVLFLNSAYIAHLGAFDRKLAIKLNVYKNSDAEGCHDWDTFIKFMIANHKPVHIPEIIYSWRMHKDSTAMNISSKSFIRESHKSILNRFISGLPNSDDYQLVNNPFFQGKNDWWIKRVNKSSAKMLTIVLRTGNDSNMAMLRDTCKNLHHDTLSLKMNSNPTVLLEILHSSNYDLVSFVSENIRISNPNWDLEALSLFEIHKDVVMIGGLTFNKRQKVVGAGIYFGVGNLCDTPYKDLSIKDPIYNSILKRQHSVSAFHTQLCVFEISFLVDFLKHACPDSASLSFLGMWAGAYALRENKRVAYSPFISAKTEENWDELIQRPEKLEFLKHNKDIIPDTRYYHKLFNVKNGKEFQPKLHDCST